MRLPSPDPELIVLRPLAGAFDETVAIHERVANETNVHAERLSESRFPVPTTADLTDAAGAHLLWQASRLALREGATPFRSLGRISIRPRTYQFVPLLMALRLEPIRMLIADDVGVGKTVEALLIARELLDRGEIRRFCVLCPSYLCDQWQRELKEKFNLDAAVIRPGTVNQLEQKKPRDVSIYKHYPVQVASIDFLKGDRTKHAFLLDCPELVIVDEAHGCAANSGNANQHQRHAFLKEIAKDQRRNLILLTATPHSGVEAAFQSLLGLLKPGFAQWQVASLDEQGRAELAKHFVQRTRGDIVGGWESDHCFPNRVSSDATYKLSPAYRDLFEKAFAFCSEIVKSGDAMDKRKGRVQYWAALGLLRCVMSSPAAALAAMENRHASLASEGEDVEDFRAFIFESSDDSATDELPTPPIESANQDFTDSDRRKLRELANLALPLHGTTADTKLAKCAAEVEAMLSKGMSPIIWCRYIATAEYVAEGLQKKLKGTRVVAVTGRQGDEDRRAVIADLINDPKRVLVATDCLSEGINLQSGFNAVIHYDLPWNPNRLEQREGRVDRYGQAAPQVEAVRLFAPESPVDGVVIDVLLNKAKEIHRSLGTHVPVPQEGESVTEAILNALFLRGPSAKKLNLQMGLDLEFDLPELDAFNTKWDEEVNRQKASRTRFAQHGLKPDEVRKELEATDNVLGDPDAVREFVLAAAQRLDIHIDQEKNRDIFQIVTRSTTPALVRHQVPTPKAGPWRVSFISPTPDGATYLGRNHPFVATLAQFLMEQAIVKPGEAVASRCGVIKTKAVQRVTTLFLLRARCLVNIPEKAPMLSEEVRVEGFTSQGALSAEDALKLLLGAKPDANVSADEKRERIEAALTLYRSNEADLTRALTERAGELERSHKRIRQAVDLRIRDLKVEPQLPPDLLGVLVLIPVVGP